MSDEDDDLPGGPIQRHSERTKPFTPALGSEDAEVLEAHIDRSFGKVESVFHELLSDLVHVDVHHIPATPERNFVIVTTGMSDLPMTPPEGAEEYRFAELMIHLPPDWQISDAAFEAGKFYWPVRLLKTLARLPHEYDTWLWWGHTLPNGDPAEPYDPSVAFNCAMLKSPSLFLPESARVECSPDKVVHFFAVAPLYTEEVELKLRKGAQTLIQRWNRRNITPELISADRPNVARRTWWPF